MAAAGTVLQTEVEYVIREGDYPTTVASLWQVRFDVLMTLNGWRTLQDAGIVPPRSARSRRHDPDARRRHGVPTSRPHAR